MKLTKKEKEALEALSLLTDNEIVSHYPFRYEEIVNEPFLEWEVNGKVAFEGVLQAPIRTSRFKGRTVSRFQLLVEDQYLIKVVIYNRSWLGNTPVGSIMTIIGKYQGKDNVVASQYNLKSISTQEGLNPVYHLKSGITNKRFTSLVKELLKQDFPNIIPPVYQEKYRLLNRKQALDYLHFPQSQQQIDLARRTLKYEEFLLFQLSVVNRKNVFSAEGLGVPKKFSYDEVFRLINTLPFNLTVDQVKAINEILADLQSKKVMYRMLQGDVGSGKTLVAAASMLACALAGKQVAFMAPTEILAKQQTQYFKDLFKDFKLRIACLTASLKTKQKEEIKDDLAQGNIDIIVGTHALIQDTVNFNDLGLVITDEQHRFGVNQRHKLKSKGDKVDYLLMSATPIPRTLANILFGDMDISIIESMPEERKAIITKFIPQNSMVSIMDWLISMIKDQNRCYVVCPAIEESENVEMRDATSIQEALIVEINEKRQEDINISVLHGKLSSEEKEKVMDDFKHGKSQILVTTTVIEVGINVKEANIMVIYDAHRFGLSQLHQLRGRVGRGSKQGYCYLLSATTDPLALKRLEFIAGTTNGFEIANYDLSNRGPGDVLGSRQSGIPSFILGNIITDLAIIDTAKQDAQEILSNLDDPYNKKVLEHALKIWE